MPNKYFAIRKWTIWGATLGIFSSLSLLYSHFILVPLLLALTSCKRNVKKRRIYALILYVIIASWIITKWWLVAGLGKHVLQDLFVISILVVFSLLNYGKFILKGLVFIISPIVLLDIISNMMQLMLGVDFFGNSPDALRNDGMRLVGIFGHSFISLGLYLSYFLLLLAADYKRWLAYIPIFFMLTIGSLRAYIFIPVLLFANILFSKSWNFVFIKFLIIPIMVAWAVFLSISTDLLSGTSGNAFRLFAWQNAIIVIQENPIIGIDKAPPPLPNDFSVNEESLIEYQIYESGFLQDAVRYGLPFVFVKLLFLYFIGGIHYEKNVFEGNNLSFAKNLIVALLITDYFIFSYFSMPLTIFIAGSILGTASSQKI